MSGWFAEEQTVRVELGECLCPNTPHSTGDAVEIRPELDLRSGLAVYARLAADDAGNLAENLARSWLRAGIVAWTFVDENGAPVPVSPELIDRLRFTGSLWRLANELADRYGEDVLSPLVEAARTSSPDGPSEPSTSPIPQPSRTRRTP